MDREHRRRIDLSHVLRVGALFADWRGPHRACTEPIAIAAGRHPTKYAETGKKICGRILTTRCYAEDVKNYIRALADLSQPNTVANIFISLMYRQRPALFIGRSLPPRNNSHFGVRVTRSTHAHTEDTHTHTERKKEKIEFSSKLLIIRRIFISKTRGARK